MGPARRAHHPKVRNGCSSCSPRTGAQTVREPRPSKSSDALRLLPYLSAYGQKLWAMVCSYFVVSPSDSWAMNYNQLAVNDFARFRKGVLRSSRSPREAIYAEAAWIVLYNPIVLYDDVGGGCRG